MPLWILKEVREIDCHILLVYSGSWWSINVNRRSDIGFPGAKISAQICLLGVGDHKLEARKAGIYLHLEGQAIFHIHFPAWQLSRIRKSEMSVPHQPALWEGILWKPLYQKRQKSKILLLRDACRHLYFYSWYLRTDANDRVLWIYPCYRSSTRNLHVVITSKS